MPRRKIAVDWPQHHFEDGLWESVDREVHGTVDEDEDVLRHTHARVDARAPIDVPIPRSRGRKKGELMEFPGGLRREAI